MTIGSVGEANEERAIDLFIGQTDVDTGSQQQKMRLCLEVEKKKLYSRKEMHNYFPITTTRDEEARLYVVNDSFDE